ncbi:unnamed protein product [Schistosoma margrebowiei]|uniref:DUF6451 domain-containing protein n=1 Tax=Schistosoma margrebowiei TaxID=48269 RepID=A0A3P8F9M3_9TREM|nr:unnamed protein product [Schistosoma margrebowiei]
MEDIESFTYLRSIIDEQGGSDANVNVRIGKVRAAFLQLKNIWNSKQLSTNIKVTIINTNVNPITLDGGTLEDIESFTYLRSIIDEQGGSDANVNVRIGKVWAAFLQLKNIWNSKQLSTNIKVTIINTNVRTVLLYGAETSRTITTIIEKVQIFINSCLREIFNIH